MKQYLLLFLLFATFTTKAQSVIQVVNSGSIIVSSSSVSVGEIIIVPENQNQSGSGIIGILAQVNQQTLEVPQLDLSDNVTVYPNPTVAKIFFDTNENLANENVFIYNSVGQLVLEKKITAENSVDLSNLSSGIYMIQFSNKNIKTFKIIKR